MGSVGASWGGGGGASTTRVLAASRFGGCPSVWFGEGRPLLACPPWGAVGVVSEKETTVCRTGSSCFVAAYPCRLLEGRWPEGGKLQRVDAIRQLGNADDANTTGLAVLKRADVGVKQQAYAMSS